MGKHQLFVKKKLSLIEVLNFGIWGENNCFDFFCVPLAHDEPYPDSFTYLNPSLSLSLSLIKASLYINKSILLRWIIDMA